MKDLLLSKLDKVTGNGVNYKARCPAHEDRTPSLSLLFNPDGRILIHCHASCSPDEVLESIGLTMSDLFPDGAIRDFMASANVRKKKEPTHDHYLLDVAQGMRERGVKLTPDEMRQERAAFLRVKKADG